MTKTNYPDCPECNRTLIPVSDKGRTMWGCECGKWYTPRMLRVIEAVESAPCFGRKAAEHEMAYAKCRTCGYADLCADTVKRRSIRIKRPEKGPSITPEQADALTREHVGRDWARHAIDIIDAPINEKRLEEIRLRVRAMRRHMVQVCTTPHTQHRGDTHEKHEADSNGLGVRQVLAHAGRTTGPRTDLRRAEQPASEVARKNQHHQRSVTSGVQADAALEIQFI